MTTDQLTAPSLRHVPLAPILSALRSLCLLYTRKELATRWAIAGNRSENSARRYLERIFAREMESLSIAKADEICVYIIGCHPINLYGDEW